MRPAGTSLVKEYLGSGEYRERFLGVKIPVTNLQPGQLDEARRFAARLADGLSASGRPQEAATETAE